MSYHIKRIVNLEVNTMTVSGTKLVPLVEEYFQLEEYPEGEPLEETRSLKEIVSYLKTKCNEVGLGEISTSTDGLGDKKERNINDKVRRVLKKMHNISSTTGKTSKKKYYRDEGEDAGVLTNRFYGEIFTMNEIIGGGNQKTETFLKTASSLDSVLPLSDFFWGSRDDSEADMLHDLLDIETQAPKFNNQFLETAPFELINEGDSLKNDSTKWFTNNPAWMENQYYGFQGSVGLVSVLDNIRNNIEKNDISKISEILKIDSKELKWLKRQYSSRQDRMPNRTVITLALLHLNRSLLGPIPVR